MGEYWPWGQASRLLIKPCVLGLGQVLASRLLIKHYVPILVHYEETSGGSSTKFGGGQRWRFLTSYSPLFANSSFYHWPFFGSFSLTVCCSFCFFPLTFLSQFLLFSMSTDCGGHRPAFHPPLLRVSLSTKVARIFICQRMGGGALAPPLDPPLEETLTSTMHLT